METTGAGEEVKTIVYLQTVKRTSNYLKYSDAASDVGGFYIFISFVFGGFVNCINKKIFLKRLVHDSYQVHYDKDYFGIPYIIQKHSKFMARYKKKGESKKVDEEKDKEGFSDAGKKSDSGKKK